MKKPLQDWLNSLKNLGVDEVGYTNALEPQSFKVYEKWVESKNHLPLHYLSDQRYQKRKNLKNYWPDTKSALVFLFSYKNVHRELNRFYQKDPMWNGLKIGSFTMGFEGADYHKNIKEKLSKIGDELCLVYPNLKYKLSLDVHPILERDLAFRSGIGWFGKNSMLINRTHGSFTLIGALLLDQELDLPIKKTETDHCGQCNRCVEACPTNAIDVETRTIIAKDCISTFTIEEFRIDTVPSLKMDLSSGFIFGCDICQDVCPWNKRLDRIFGDFETNNDPQIFSENQNKMIGFFLKRNVIEIYNEISEMSERHFRKIFADSSFERSGRRGILKNLKLYLKQLNIFS